MVVVIGHLTRADEEKQAVQQLFPRLSLFSAQLAKRKSESGGNSDGKDEREGEDFVVIVVIVKRGRPLLIRTRMDG